EVSEVAACAFCDLAETAGAVAGFVKVPVEVGSEFVRFAQEWLPRLSGVADGFDKALLGGLGRVRGSGRFGFGNLAPADLRLSELRDDERRKLADGGSWYPEWADELAFILQDRSDERPFVFAPHWIDV